MDDGAGKGTLHHEPQGFDKEWMVIDNEEACRHRYRLHRDAESVANRQVKIARTGSSWQRGGISLALPTSRLLEAMLPYQILD